MRKLFLALSLLLISTTANAEHIVSKEAHIDINTDRAVHVKGPIYINMKDRLRKEFQLSETLGDKELVVIIDSPGGDVDFGQQIIDAVDYVKTTLHKRVVCVVDGDASSMGFNLLTHCDVRLATIQSRMVVHKIEWPNVSTAYPMRHTAEFYRKVAKKIDEIDEPYRQANAKAMHLPLWDYDHFADNETDWTASLLKIIGYLQGIATVTP